MDMHGLDVSDVKMEERAGTLRITGQAENTSGKEYAYASLKYRVRDEKGETVDEPVASTSGLKHGATWEFVAVCEVPKADSFELIDVYAWTADKGPKRDAKDEA